jgi:hypothetical protein
VEDAATMNHWIGNPAISIVAANKEIECPAIYPLFGLHIWEGSPCERTFRHCLIKPVHSERIVCTGTAEGVAPIAITDIAEGAGVDEKTMMLVSQQSRLETLLSNMSW